jgi:hypothetical protein
LLSSTGRVNFQPAVLTDRSHNSVR